jgi:curved DNA-binding protein CbpA
LAHDFIDYYEILEISPNAQPETIHRVYRLLAQSYHPDNQDTGDTGRFSLVLESYRVLSDPERRASYDVEHQASRATRWKIFDQSTAMQGIAAEKRKRGGILTLLYTKRMTSPEHPSLNLFELEQLLGCPREHLELSLWYLKESGRVARGDSGRYSITCKGLETVEESAEQIEPRLCLPEPIHMPAATDKSEEGRLRPV